MEAATAQVQPAAGDADAMRRRQSLQWGDAHEGSGFPGRMPEHDAEDDYEELLQVGKLRRRENQGKVDTLGAGPAVAKAAMVSVRASMAGACAMVDHEAACVWQQHWITLACVNCRRHGKRWTPTCALARRC